MSAAQLTRDICAASHPQQLLTLLLAHGPSCNPVHLTAAAEALLRLARQQQQMRDPAYKRKVRGWLGLGGLGVQGGGVWGGGGRAEGNMCT
jgi:hypothetical protein